MRTFGKAKYPGRDRAEAQCGKHSFDFRTKFDIEKYSFVPVFWGFGIGVCVCVSVVCRCKLHSVKHVHCPHGRTIYIVVFMANVTL